MSLIEALTDGAWSGSAELSIDDEQINLGRLPLRWDPQTLDFTFELQVASEAFSKLEEVDWWRSPGVRLSDVRIAHGPWTLAAPQVRGFRCNALSEWPEDFEFNSDETRSLRVGLIAESRITFACQGPAEQPLYSIWWSNWPTALWLPSRLESPQALLGCLPHGGAQHRPTALVALLGDDPAIRDVHKRLNAVLSLACGAPVRPRATRFGDALCVHRLPAYLPPSQLPMFKEAQGRGPIAHMLAVAAEWSDAEFERLRYAAALTVEAKAPQTPLEMRYLLLMMCVETLDERRELSIDSTGCMLGVDATVAELLNGMRNKLVHAHDGGSHVAAFNAFVKEQWVEGLRELPAPWSTAVDTKEEKLRFDRLYFQLCERLDAYWCRRFGLTDVQDSRFHVAERATLCDLPRPYALPPARAPKKGDSQTEVDKHVEALKAQVKRTEGLNAQLRKQGKAYKELKHRHADLEVAHARLLAERASWLAGCKQGDRGDTPLHPTAQQTPV